MNILITKSKYNFNSGLGRGERGYSTAPDARHGQRNRRLRPAEPLRRGEEKAGAQFCQADITYAS